MKFVKHTILLLLLVTMPGCAGLAVGTYGKMEQLYSSPSLTKGRGHYGVSLPRVAYSEAEIVEFWGRPDVIREKGSCRLLVYKDGVAWSGVGAFVVIVPVPLLIPTGHYEKTFYLKDEKCVGLISQYGEVRSAFGFMCGDEKCGFVAGDAHNGTRKITTDFCN